MFLVVYQTWIIKIVLKLKLLWNIKTVVKISKSMFQSIYRAEIWLACQFDLSHQIKVFFHFQTLSFESSMNKEWCFYLKWSIYGKASFEVLNLIKNNKGGISLWESVTKSHFFSIFLKKSNKRVLNEQKLIKIWLYFKFVAKIVAYLNIV